MTPVFDKLWDDMGLSDENLRELQNILLKNQFAGDIIQETGGARKIRFASPNIGKSGGVRVIYVNIPRLKRIYLLLCYPKSKQDDLTPEQKKQIKVIVKTLKGA